MFKANKINFCLDINISQRMFFIVRAISAFESFYFICHGNLYSIPAFFVGILTLSLIFLYIYNKGKKEKWFANEIKLYLIIIVSAIELPLYFLASARIAHEKEYKDETIVKIDTFLLGHFFPKGQLSLYLDENKTFGPLSKWGKIINNILLVIYFTYYLIPYVFVFMMLLRKCLIETIYRYKNKGEKSNNYNDTWSKFYFCISVLILTYFQILFINTFVPAISPRLYLKDEYKNDLVYIGLNKIIGNIKDDKSANSFPSGHVAETFCLVFPFFVMKRYFIAIFILIDSLLISLATLVLRYHYFSDVLMGMLNSLIAFVICYIAKYEMKSNIKNSNYENIPFEDIGDLVDKKEDIGDLVDKKEDNQVIEY
jgi:membrane-associated phospholipid phosphatase